MSNKMGEGASTLVQVASSVPFNSREESMTLRSGLGIKFLPVARRLPQERGEREREVSFMQMCSRSLINWGSWLSFLRLSELSRASLASALYGNFWPLFSVQPKREDGRLFTKKKVHPLRGKMLMLCQVYQRAATPMSSWKKEKGPHLRCLRRRPADWAPYGHVIVIVRLVTSFSIHSIQLCWRSALCRWPSSPSISYIRSRSTVTTGISDICLLLSYLLSSCQHQRSNSGRQDIIEAHAFLSAILPLQQFPNWLPCQLVTAARTFKGGQLELLEWNLE